MAPRRRPRKRGLTRMDAALDAMKMNYGFTDEAVVLTTVKELLELYGDDGWPFIEENSYRVLLDTMLEKGAEDLPKSNELQKKESAGNDVGTPPAGTSIVPPVSTCHAMEVVTLASQANDAPDSASESRSNHNTLEIDDTDAHLSTLEGEGNSWKDETLNQGCREEQVIEFMGTNDRSFGVDKLGTSSKPPAHMIVSPQPVHCLPHCRCKPCYGWISDDDEDDEDGIVHLPPAPISAELAQLLCEVGDARKRKRIWDVRQEYRHHGLQKPWKKCGGSSG